MFKKQIQKAKEQGKPYVTIRKDTAYKAIQQNNCRAVCDYRYTDDYAYDNANNFGKGEVSKEFILEEVKDADHCYIDLREPNRLHIRIHSNLYYSVYFEEEQKENKQHNNNQAITVTYKENEEMNGIELYFSAIPSENIRNELKEIGFRWSKRGFWYAKRTEKTKLFAESLVSIYEDIKAGQDQEKPSQLVEVEEITDQSEPNGKIKAKQIIFEWSESEIIPDGLTVSTFTEADKIVKKAALAKTGMGYDKTAFKIVYEDGQTYEGRIDINSKDNNLTNHVLNFVECMAGIRKPVHLTDEQWKNYIKDYQNDYLDFYNRYQIGDITGDITEPAEQNQAEANNNSTKVISLTDKLKAKEEEKETRKLLKQFEHMVKNLTHDELLDLQKKIHHENKEIAIAELTRYLLIASARELIK